MRGGKWPYDEKPLLVFWETTKACLLKCLHCRAEAIKEPLPGELTTEEGLKLIDMVAGFGKPSPILIFTGGDPLMREDIWNLLDYAKSNGIRTAIAPSVTPLLTEEAIKKLSNYVGAVSLSLDSPHPEVHDAIRGIEGTWKKTVQALQLFRENGVRVQVNSVVMRKTVDALPEMVKLLKDIGITTWEVFYIIPVGRGERSQDLTPSEWEDVSHFLYEASRYGIKIRTTEGPIFRRVALTRKYYEERGELDKLDETLGPLYHDLIARLRDLIGDPEGPPQAHTVGTMDGRGVVFISYNGNVYPSGFLPLSAGNIREKSLIEIYRRSALFSTLRKKLKGRCGRCEFKNLCGGSRARAFSYTGDPFAEDPSCIYKPGSLPREIAEGIGG